MPTPDEHYLKKELYARFAESPEIFDFLQRGSLDGLWYWDLENQENEWLSPQFWEAFGYDPATKEHSPESWQDIIDPDDAAAMMEEFNKHLADPAHPFKATVRYRHADGHTVWIECRGIIIRDDAGTPIRALGAHHDVTALKEAQEQLQNTCQELQERIRLLDNDPSRTTAEAVKMMREVANNLRRATEEGADASS